MMDRIQASSALADVTDIAQRVRQSMFYRHASAMLMLWGVLTANVFYFPMANRLKRVSEVECDQMEAVIEGVLAIQAGSNPRLVAQKLNSMLALNEADDERDAA